MQHASADVEKLLIGNKCDWEARRAVPKERGESLARSQNVHFLETSAKTNYNIDEAFEKLARLILKKVSFLMVQFYSCVINSWNLGGSSQCAKSRRDS